jgi:hypothetical protein
MKALTMKVAACHEPPCRKRLDYANAIPLELGKSKKHGRYMNLAENIVQVPKL